MTLPLTLVHRPIWDEPFEGVTAELPMMAVIELAGQSLKTARQLELCSPNCCGLSLPSPKLTPQPMVFFLGPQCLCLSQSGDDLPQTTT